MSDKKDSYLEILQGALNEEKILERMAQSDYNTGITKGKIQAQLATVTQLLCDSVESLEKGITFNDEKLEPITGDQPTPIESLCIRLNTTWNESQEKLGVSLLDLENLELLTNEVKSDACGDDTSHNKRRVDMVVDIVKTVAWGSPILKSHLAVLLARHPLFASIARVFEDFCEVVVHVESELIQILGNVNGLKMNERKEYDVQLESVYFEVVSGLKAITMMRNLITPAEPFKVQESSEERPFSSAVESLVQSSQAMLSHIMDGKVTIESVETQVRFLEPLLNIDRGQLNAEQKSIGLKVVLDTAKNVPAVHAQLHTILNTQRNIHVATKVFISSFSELKVMQSNFVRLSA